jgi:MFS family permease
MTTSAQSHVAFAALRQPGYGMFFVGNAIVMMADNAEHVITYLAIDNTFHRPALGGIAVLAHWLPFLLFANYSGALTDRFDPRRMIQIGLLLFMTCSITWGVLLHYGHLQVWHAVALLTLHGIAGVFWTPAAQVLIQYIVRPQFLQSAVRLGATGRFLGTLTGPVIGNVLLLTLGSSTGIFFNALIYLPLLLWLWRAPYGPRFQPSGVPPRPALRGVRDMIETLQIVRQHPQILCMILLAGGAAFFIGSAYQAQMPRFAADLGGVSLGTAYAALLGADAAGALTAGMLLESLALLKARSATAILLTVLWCVAIGGFALTHNYLLSLALLFMAGFLDLSFNSMAQTLVQLHAPIDHRGRIIGMFVMAGMGLRFFSGISVGLFGELVGVHWSLASSAAGLLLWALWLAWRFRPAQRPRMLAA